MRKKYKDEKINIKIKNIERINELICDGILV